MPSLDSICKKLSFLLIDYPNPLVEHDVKVEDILIIIMYSLGKILGCWYQVGVGYSILYIIEVESLEKQAFCA